MDQLDQRTNNRNKLMTKQVQPKEEFVQLMLRAIGQLYEKFSMIAAVEYSLRQIQSFNVRYEIELGDFDLKSQEWETKWIENRTDDLHYTEYSHPENASWFVLEVSFFDTGEVLRRKMENFFNDIIDQFNPEKISNQFIVVTIKLCEEDVQHFLEIAEKNKKVFENDVSF